MPLDYQLNNRQFIGQLFGAPNPNAPKLYLEAVENKEMDPLDFTMYIPPGYGAKGKFLPVKETTDPARIFMAEFAQGHVHWPDAKGTITE